MNLKTEMAYRVLYECKIRQNNSSFSVSISLSLSYMPDFMQSDLHFFGRINLLLPEEKNMVKNVRKKAYTM